MRKIKFRVWCKNKNECEKNFSAIGQDGCLFQVGEFWKAISQDNHIIMQFTGLLDKNGKEIYEGDIVKCLHTPAIVGKVEWNTGCLTYKVGIYDLAELPGFQEVIGNIHENSGVTFKQLKEAKVSSCDLKVIKKAIKEKNGLDK